MQGFSREPGTKGPLADVPVSGARRVWRWAALVALGGFLFGYDTGAVAGALLFLRVDLGLGAAERGGLVGALPFGAVIGALCAGRLVDRLGQRAAFGLEGLAFLVGTGLAVFAPGYPVLLVARLVLGLAVGGASVTVPVYLSELAPAALRRRVLALNQAMVAAGILVAYLVCVAFSAGGQWRAMFGLGAVPSAAMVVAALLVLPDSPEWLFTHGQRDRARAVLASVTAESRANTVAERWHAAPQATTRRRLLAHRVRPALAVAFGLAVAQQFGGINTILYLAPTILRAAGSSAAVSLWYAVPVGAVHLAATLLSIRLTGRYGRRPLLLASLLGMLIATTLLGVTFAAGLGGVAALLLLALDTAAFALGLGPVYWLLTGELLPPEARAAGSAAATTANWLASLLVGTLFLTVAGAIGGGPVFWILAGFCAAGLWFVARYVPETRNRDFPHVDRALRSRFRYRPPA